MSSGPVAGDYSVASVFDYTDSTGYKWVSDSESEDTDLEGSDGSEKAAVQAAFSKFNIDDLKKAAKGPLQPHFTPLHQSTPAMPNSHQMSGSTIRNDRDQSMETPSKLGRSIHEEVGDDQSREDGLKQAFDSLPSEMRQNVLGYIHRITSNGVKNNSSPEFEQKPIASSSPNDEVPVSTSSSPNEPSVAASSSSPNVVPVSASPPNKLADSSSPASDHSTSNVRFHFPNNSHRHITVPSPKLESVTDSDVGERTSLLDVNKTTAAVNGSMHINRSEDQSEISFLNRNEHSELTKLKAYLLSLENGDQLLNQFENNDRNVSISTTATPSIRAIGPENMPDSRKRIPDHQKLYNRLEMTKVDALDEVEAKNMIKNVLLLLGAPLSQLPDTLTAIVKTLRREDIYYQFAVDIHKTLYCGESIEAKTPEQHHACLNKMTHVLQTLFDDRSKPSSHKRRF
ncbi:hypothetical protein TRICI_001133 [Trichomonascus ciferrii]|uniref:Uncharacterized protein n=1 Tax=Trichomonascus ciferrii TaxID=44093 RepID=A0A642VCL1_9ASCO|nr:hypothetical protein TRICI_001133 [Trichomonascus ciferrii]